MSAITHDGNKWKCSQCGYTFATQREAVHHEDNGHKDRRDRTGPEGNKSIFGDRRVDERRRGHDPVPGILNRRRGDRRRGERRHHQYREGTPGNAWSPCAVCGKPLNDEAHVNG